MNLRKENINRNIGEDRFVHEFLTDFNPRQAAIRAGYAPSNASAAAYRLLNSPTVIKAIAQIRERMVAKFEIDRDMIVSELAKIAFADPRNFFDREGYLKDVHELDDVSAAALMSVDIEELYAGTGQARIKIGQIKKLRRWDKVKALDVLCKIFGFYAPVKVDNMAPAALTDDQFQKLLTAAASETKTDQSE